MADRRVEEIGEALRECARLLGADRCAPLLLDAVRALAEGRPVPAERLDRMAAAHGVSPEEVERVVWSRAERGDQGLVGIMGLSLNPHPHRFRVDGVQLWTWCAEDTLFLPAVLGRTAVVESESPVSGTLVRLVVDPQGVREAEPAGAVLSVISRDPDPADFASLQGVWDAF